MAMQRDNDALLRLLKTSRGQIDGIIRMVEQGKYCIDVSNQIAACQAILTKVNKQILHAHLSNCVAEAAMRGEGQAYMDEVMSVLDKLIK